MNIILDKVHKLIKLYKNGTLGGAVMPEDANPHLPKSSNENYIYFTLPMALNYQRNSYKLWEAANKSFSDKTTSDIFIPHKAAKMNFLELQKKLLKHKTAIQPDKNTKIWQTISETIANNFDGDLRNLFIQNSYSIKKIKGYILSNKKSFPYLGGAKILNYWLYVMEQHTDAKFSDRQLISIAPDTHVIQASVKLGIIGEDEINKTDIRERLAQRWQELLKDQTICPIDVHTPLWLWSRNGFKEEL
ncbi:MAG: hypothetical protein LBR70_06745 [Lactobacillaceae bacterium]|jgi:hypothetical protein|nr:hypothetical protein [Lactobacillaceae bacterium]